MSFNRFLFLVHRYLGIALGVLMVMWCVSGIVMIYVPYPALVDDDRLRGLEPLSASECCALVGKDFPTDDTPLRSFHVEMLGGHPVLRLAGPRLRNYDLTTGAAIAGIAEEQARAIAHIYAAAHGIAGVARVDGRILWDQWTVGGFRADRPLYRIAFDDAPRTELYVSSVSGQVVQFTNQPIRFWNWLGSVPHWLYFSSLRSNPPLWSQIVIWTSLIGCVLTIVGIYIGIRQVKRRRSDGKLASPYRGFWYWHHVPGLVFGVFTLTWVFSGLLSMNPWGYLGGGDPTPVIERLNGAEPDWATIRAALPQILRALPPGTVNIQSAPWDGKLFVVAFSSDGTRTRLNTEGAPSPLRQDDYAEAALKIGGESAANWSLLRQEDAYSYGRSNDPPPFPVLRVITGGADGARFYLDAVTGRLVRFADADGRTFRWLFSGLHSLDFNSVLRWRPFWDVMMVVLLLGATVVCGTGTWIGLKRLIGRPQCGGLLGGSQEPPAKL